MQRRPALRSTSASRPRLFRQQPKLNQVTRSGGIEEIARLCQPHTGNGQKI